MKRAVVVLAMALSMVAGARAEVSGTIHFKGVITHGTCADLPAVTSSAAPRAPGQCTLRVTSIGGSRDAPIYLEHTRAISDHSGIDILDYYVDSVRAHSSKQVLLLTREYI